MQQPAKNNFITILFTFFFLCILEIFTRESLNILNNNYLFEMKMDHYQSGNYKRHRNVGNNWDKMYWIKKYQ